MSKIAVIISHEYRTRVRAKWFIVSTLLAPFGLALLIAVPVLAAILAGDGAEGKVAVLDRTGMLAAAVVQADTATFELAGNRTETQLSEAVKSEEIQAYVVIPSNVLDSGRITMFSRGGSGIAFESSVQGSIEPLIVKARLQKVGTDTAVIGLVERGIEVVSLKVTDKGIEADSSQASAMVGYAAGFMIYMLIFLYGTMVMRGVVEEKANRIIEVIASSARPFEIMMGKVVGIGLVGLTQLVLWVALGSLVTMGVGALIAPSVSPETMNQVQQMQANNPSQGMGLGGALAASGIVLPNISMVSILMFIFNFFAGYFLYASLFAAVGSAVDQESDANSLTFPITFPVILTMLFIGNVIAAPNGTFAVVASMIPLFSPILMTVRVAATDVPAWQLLTSIALSIGGFFGAIWLASRIYRIGILSYGKKPTLKEIARWITLRV
ncbi:MAG: ABC transporter permease [Ignavibacteria bacterium]|nr:ABC transporter permease [Ignavibacteria bacterium]